MKELAVLTKAMIAERRDIMLAIVAGFIAGVAGVALFASSGYLISQAAFAPPLYTLIILTSVVKMLGLIRAGSRYGERLISHRATFSLLGRMRTAFFAKLAPLAPALFHQQRSGDLLAQIVGDIESLQNHFLRVVYPPIMLVMVFLATILFTAFISLWIALLFVLGVFLTSFVVPAYFTFRQRRFSYSVRKERAVLSTDAAEFLYGFRDLKVYQQLEKKESKLTEASKTLVAQQKKMNRNLLWSQSLNTFFAFMIAWAVLGLGAYLVASGELAGVFLAMLVMIALTVFEEAVPMAALPAYKQETEQAAKRLSETIKPQTEKEKIDPQHVLVKNDPVAIKLQDLSFQFPNEWRPSLSAIDLTFPAGSKTAIVGPSGSGKSTIIEILLKLYPATEGKVLLNEIAIEDIQEESVWKAAKVVLQENHFFYGTIRDNLLLEENRTDEELIAVLQKVQLPQLKLNEQVLEKAENFSDGEKQRLAIARVLLKKGSFWLLDEPTSSLDPLTEKVVLEELFLQAKNDTVLMISHRLSVLENMDQIVVMNEGRVIEKGTFHELMEAKGYFFEMKRLEEQLL